jgi:hypothetical protein
MPLEASRSPTSAGFHAAALWLSNHSFPCCATCVLVSATNCRTSFARIVIRHFGTWLT